MQISVPSRGPANAPSQQRSLARLIDEIGSIEVKLRNIEAVLGGLNTELFGPIQAACPTSLPKVASDQPNGFINCLLTQLDDIQLIVRAIDEHVQRLCQL